MRFFKYLALAGLVSLAACNNDDTPQVKNSNEGTTYAGMYISAEKSIASRALNEDHAGRDAESVLVTLDLLSTGGDQAWTQGTANQKGYFWEVSSKVYTVAPWKTTAGKQTMALIVNKGDLQLPPVATASAHLFGTAATAKEDIAKLSTDNKFVMTSARATKAVLDDKDEPTVKGGDSEDVNVFKFDLERVVAQGLVAKDAALAAETKDGKGSIDLGSLKYAAINGAVPTYLFANNAGERTITEGTGIYNDFTSAIDSYIDFETAKNPANVTEKLIRLGNIKAEGTNDLGGYAAKDVFENKDAAKTKRGIYFLENSVDKIEFKKAKNKEFGFYRLAYAKVYAKYTPKKVYKWDGKKMVETETLTESDGTFYKGEVDNLLYDTKESAKQSSIAANQAAFTYKKGMCAYRALWNRQVDPTKGKTVTGADTRRNNVYLLTITEFQGLGMPWDPSDPADPNLPKPEDDPETDPDNPNIEESETYMRVQATVLPWNLVGRDVSLKN